MDRGTGKAGTEGTREQGNKGFQAPRAPEKPQRQVLEGYVKDGVVHLLGGELPDGIFVKVIRE
jgi:hypothetical protein